MGNWFLQCGCSLQLAQSWCGALGSLRDGRLGQPTDEEEPDGGLDLPGGDDGTLVVVGELAGLLDIFNTLYYQYDICPQI